MTRIYSVIFCLFFNARSCQLQIMGADDHTTTITWVAEYDWNIDVYESWKFPPTILDDSQCTIRGKLVCVCISEGYPVPLITWDSTSLTDFLASSCSSIQMVNSTISMPASDYNNTKCISINELGRAEIEMQLQNYKNNSRQNCPSDGRQTLAAALPWIISGVSFSLNLVLIIGLICTYKWAKRTPEKAREQINTYASLCKADVEQVYSVISPQPT